MLVVQYVPRYSLTSGTLDGYGAGVLSPTEVRDLGWYVSPSTGMIRRLTMTPAECTSAVSSDVEGRMYEHAKSLDITLITISLR